MRRRSRPHEPAEREAERGAARADEEEVVRGVAERERARHRGRHGGAVEHERGAVVDEALALDERHDALGHAKAAEDRGGGDGVGGGDDRAEHEGRAPAQAGDDRVGDHGDGAGGEQDEDAGQQRHAGRVGAQVARGGEPAGRVQERRQEDEEDHVGRDLDLRHARQVADADAREHEQERVRDLQRTGDPHGSGGDGEQREQDLDVVHHRGR